MEVIAKGQILPAVPIHIDRTDAGRVRTTQHERRQHEAVPDGIPLGVKANGQGQQTEQQDDSVQTNQIKDKASLEIQGMESGLPGLRFSGETITPCLWGPNAQASLSGCLSLTCWAMGSELPSSSMRTKTSRVVVTTLSSWL